MQLPPIWLRLADTQVEFDTTLSKMMLDWCEKKDIGRVAGRLDEQPRSLLRAWVSSGR